MSDVKSSHISKMMSDVKYPHIRVKLVGGDGNAFVILGKMQRELLRNGVSREEVDEFLDEARSGDYNNLLCTCMKWVNVE